MINLDKDKKYLLACSFGPDSMALFDMLLKEKYSFSVAHVNYNLRPESKKETLDLKDYCDYKNIEFFVYENSEIINKNIEEKCREIRYNFFQKIYHQHKFDALLVAHNEDDYIETYLLQQKRKNLVLFYGMSGKTSLFSMNVIRPLLGFKKRDLLDYCQDHNVPYAVDSTNAENKFLRNRIRHTVVEKMTDDERVEILKEITHKNEELANVLKQVDSFDSNEVSDLIKAGRDIFPYLINHLGRKINSICEISSRVCLEIKKALKSDKPNITIFIDKNFAFVKEYDKFKFDFVGKVSFNFVVNLGDVVDNEFIFFDTNFDLNKRNLIDDDFPIRIRNFEKNDRIKVKDYEVQIRRLFIDWKMPISLRARWPIIVNKDNVVVYVPRYQKDFDRTKSPNFYVKI